MPALICGFDADVLENSDFDLFAANECSRALGKSRRFDTGVRDNEHALQAQRRNVVADFLRCSHANLYGVERMANTVSFNRTPLDPTGQTPAIVYPPNSFR